MSEFGGPANYRISPTEPVTQIKYHSIFLPLQYSGDFKNLLKIASRMSMPCAIRSTNRDTFHAIAHWVFCFSGHAAIWRRRKQWPRSIPRKVLIRLLYARKGRPPSSYRRRENDLVGQFVFNL